MAKTLISRLDAENIVRAAVDPETHEATGDVYDSVNDVSYPFGGGGGASFPYLTVNVTNDAEESYLETFVALPQTFVEENGELYLYTEFSIAPQTAENIKCIYFNNGGSTFVNFTEKDVLSSSDAVNCTIEGGFISITDPSLPASIKLVMSGDR